MKLQRIHIQNFRGITDLDLELDDTTVLIGENNSGKTSVLDALRLCLRELGPRGRVVFNTFDFHLKDPQADPSTADPIVITLTFGEDVVGEWDGSRARRLRDVLHVDEQGRRDVVFRVQCGFDPLETKSVVQAWAFLDAAGVAMHGVTEASLGVFQREAACFYLAALRDAERHFDAHGPFWRPFLRDGQLPLEHRAEIEARLKAINDLIVRSHSGFDEVCQHLARIQEVIQLGSGDVVSIEAVPGRMFDVLTKAQVFLETPSGAKVPVERHGEGTQSLAVLMLFSAFLRAQGHQTPLVALEEPEAHLHPSAVRALWGVVQGIPGQKLFSTHSGDLLSEIDVHRIRRLARTASGVRSFRVPPSLLTAEETRKFNYHVRRTRAELLFARCWLLVEGETEAWVFPAAARAKGIDLHRAGVRIIEYSQSDVGLLAKVGNALGIPWYCVADDDSGRTKYEPKVLANLGSAPREERLCFPYTSVEVHLLSTGYDAEYAALMPAENLARVKLAPGAPGYWEDYAANLPSKAKTRGAAAVAMAMESRAAAAVSPEIEAVLTKVVSLAGGR